MSLRFLLVVVIATLTGSCVHSVNQPTMSTPVPPPSSATTPSVSGVIFETTASGNVPIVNALVQVAVCRNPEYSVSSAVTDASGAYTISGLCNGRTYVGVRKDGYDDLSASPQCLNGCHYVMIQEDHATFNLQLVRRD